MTKYVKELRIIVLFVGCLLSVKTVAQQYEFYKEISGFANDPRKFQYSSGLAKISIDKFDNIYILDVDGRAVIKLDANKKFVSKWYSADYNSNEEVKKQNCDAPWSSMFDFANGIKTDHEGIVYIFGYRKIHKFDQNGIYIGTLSNVGDYKDLAFDKEGNIYAVTNNTIDKRNAKGDLLANFDFDIKPDEEDQPSIFTGIAVDNQTNVYVLDRGKGKILKFTSKGKYLGSFCKKGENEGEMLDAEGLAIDRNNNLYFADNTNWRIQCVDNKGRFKYKIGRDSSTIDKIIYPHAIVLDSRGHIYIQSLYKGIVEYDANRKYIATWGTDGYQYSCLVSPDQIYYSTDNFIYVWDEKKSDIQKFDAEGNYIEVFLKTKNMDGSSYHVSDITEDEDNNIVLLTNIMDYPLLFINKNGYYQMKYTSFNKVHTCMENHWL